MSTTTLERARPGSPHDPPALPDPAAAGGLSPRRRTMVLAAMCLALVLVIAGVSMLAVALPSVGDDLRLSSTSLTWVADAYAITLASLLLVAGAVGDRYGRRGALLVGVALFGAGSLLSALATSGGQLIAFRALTGIGGALVMPGTLSTITSVFPPEERARAVGIWAGFAGAGGTLGMLGAGWLLDVSTWPSIFVVTAVVSAITFLAILFAVPTSRASEHVGLDPLGTVLSATGIGALVLGIIEGPIHGWTAPITAVSLLAGAVLSVAFVLWELRTAHPLLDPRLFRHRGFATGSASLMLLFVALFGLFLVILQYLQLQLGHTPLAAAALLLPMTFVMLPVSTMAAPLSVRYGQKLVGGTGLLVSAAGIALFATLGEHSGFAQLVVAQVVLALGIGLSMTPATNAIVSSLPAEKQGVASAVNDTTREVGTALGIAIMGSMFTSGYRGSIDGHLDGLPGHVADQAREAPGLALEAARGLGQRGAALQDAAHAAFTSGMRFSMLVGAGLLLVGAAFVWLWGPSRADELVEDELDLSQVDVDLDPVAT